MSKAAPRRSGPGFEVEIHSGGRAHDSGVIIERVAPVLSPARAAAKAGSRRRTRLALLFVIVSLVGVVAYAWLSNPKLIVPDGAVARVNGEYIFQHDIDREISLIHVSNDLSNAGSTVPNAASVLEELISRKLQVQDARRAGVSLSSEEVDAALKNLFAPTGITMQRLEGALSGQNIKLEDMRTALVDTLLINKYIANVVVKGASSSQEASNLRAGWRTNLALTGKVDRLRPVSSGPTPRVISPTQLLAP